MDDGAGGGGFDVDEVIVGEVVALGTEAIPNDDRSGEEKKRHAHGSEKPRPTG